MTICAFDIPIHTKNISTRDFAVRSEQEVQVYRKHANPSMCGAAALLVCCMTVWYALQETLADGMHMASCIHFYVSSLTPLLLYDHILTPSRSKHMWALVIVHVASMLFAHPHDREFVSARLYVVALVLCLVITYRQAQAQREWQYVLAASASLNSAVSLYVRAQNPAASFVYYHASFVLLFAALVLLLYAH
jgi:hypothetical protein